MSFPTIVYRCPGPNAGHQYSWASMGVEDERAMDEALSAGWYRTLPEAVDGWKNVTKKPEPKPEPAIDEFSPPTREEIEQKCKELGIAVHHRHTDATLLKKIEEALNVLEQA